MLMFCIFFLGNISFFQDHEIPKNIHPPEAAAKPAPDDSFSKETKRREFTPLMVAAAGNDRAEVTTLLAQKANLKEQDTMGRTALHIAAEFGHGEMASLLVKVGARPDAEDREHVTPLMLAAMSGNLECFNVLFDLTKDAKAKDKQKQTLLHYAAMGGNPDIVATAMQQVKSIDVKDEHGNTPLMAAACRGKSTIIQFLVDRGAKLDRRNKIGDTALHLAAQHGQRTCIDALTGMGLDVDQKGRDRVTPLMAAVLAGQTDAVKSLMNMGADPKSKDRYGDSPLEYVFFLRDRDMYASICETGWPGAALHCVTRSGDVEQALQFIQNGEPIDARNPMGETPLFVAVGEGHTKLIQALLQRGADPNASTDYFWNPLYLAAWRGDRETVGLLLDEEADTNQPIGGGDTPLGAALAGNYLGIAEMLLAKGANVLYYMPKTQTAATFRDIPLQRLQNLRAEALKQGLFEYGEAPFWLRSYSEEEVLSLGSIHSRGHVEPPVFTQKVKPKYPEAASHEKMQGGVIIQAVLGKDRRIRDIRVLQPFEDWRYGFEVEAIRALQQWKFLPAKINGEEVDVLMTLKVDFGFR